MKNTHTHALKKGTENNNSEIRASSVPSHSPAPQPSWSRTVGAALGQISHPGMSSAGSQRSEPRSAAAAPSGLSVWRSAPQLRIPSRHSAELPAGSTERPGSYRQRTRSFSSASSRVRVSKARCEVPSLPEEVCKARLVAAEQFASSAWLPTELRAALRCAALNGSASPRPARRCRSLHSDVLSPKAALIRSVLSCCRDNPCCSRAPTFCRVLVLLEADEPCRAVPSNAQVIFC